MINCKNGIELNKNKYHDKYVKQFCKLLKNIDDIKYPFISVCEYGINQELVEEQLKHELKVASNVNIHLNSKVNVTKSNNNEWSINKPYKKGAFFNLDVRKDYDILVNSSGYQSNDLIQDTNPEFLELKSSWIITSKICSLNLPEIAIIGERNTIDGMIQITPLNGCLFQIHYMSKESSILHCINQDLYAKHSTVLSNYNDLDIQKRVEKSIIKINELFTGFEDSKYHDYKMGFQRIVALATDKRISELIQTDNYLEFRLLKAISIIKLINKILLDNF